MFWVVWDYSFKLKTKGQTSPKGYNTGIEILAKPGLDYVSRKAGESPGNKNVCSLWRQELF